jgi:hypothetical protein
MNGINPFTPPSIRALNGPSYAAHVGSTKLQSAAMPPTDRCDVDLSPKGSVQDVQISAERLNSAVEVGVSRIAQTAGSDGLWQTPYLAGPMHDLISSVALNRLCVKDPEFFQEEKGLYNRILDQQRPDGGLAIFPEDPNGSSKSLTRLLLVGLDACAKNQNSAMASDPKFQARIEKAREKARAFVDSDASGRTLFAIDNIINAVSESTAPTGKGMGPCNFLSSTGIRTLLYSNVGKQVAGSMCAAATGLLPGIAILAQRAHETKDRGWLSQKVYSFLHSPKQVEKAEQRLEQHIRESQDPNGGWVYMPLGTGTNLLALQSRGHGLEDPTVQNGVSYIRSMRHTARESVPGDERVYQSYLSAEVWDSSVSADVLLTAGAKADDPIIAKSIDRLISEQNSDGRWSFAAKSDKFPDTDSTAMVVRMLARAYPSANPEQQPAIKACVERAVDGVLEHQQSDGGWNAWQPCPFSIGSNRMSSFTSYLIDPSTADVTGRILTALGSVCAANILDGERAEKLEKSVPRAVEYLKNAETSDSTWWSRWSVGYVGSSGFVLPGLRAAGVDVSEPWIAKNRDFLLKNQNRDGGWGEGLEADKGRNIGKGQSTPTQTALAIMGLIASSTTDDIVSDLPLQRAVQYLIDAQKDGTWENNTPVYTNGVNFEYYHAPALTHGISCSALALYKNACHLGVSEAMKSFNAPAKD